MQWIRLSSLIYCRAALIASAMLYSTACQDRASGSTSSPASDAPSADAARSADSERTNANGIFVAAVTDPTSAVAAIARLPDASVITVLADKNSTGIATTLRGGTLKTSDGHALGLAFGADGLPGLMLLPGGLELRFSKWTANAVQVQMQVKGVTSGPQLMPVDAAALAELKKLRAELTIAAYGAAGTGLTSLEAKNVWKAVSYVALSLNVVACGATVGASIAAAAASAGVAVPLAALALVKTCGPAILGVAAMLSANPAVERLSLGVGVASCVIGVGMKDIGAAVDCADAVASAALSWIEGQGGGCSSSCGAKKCGIDACGKKCGSACWSEGFTESGVVVVVASSVDSELENSELGAWQESTVIAHELGHMCGYQEHSANAASLMFHAAGGTVVDVKLRELFKKHCAFGPVAAGVIK